MKDGDAQGLQSRRMQRQKPLICGSEKGNVKEKEYGNMHKNKDLNLYIMPIDISPEKSYYVYNDTGVANIEATC